MSARMPGPSPPASAAGSTSSRRGRGGGGGGGYQGNRNFHPGPRHSGPRQHHNHAYHQNHSTHQHPHHHHGAGSRGGPGEGVGPSSAGGPSRHVRRFGGENVETRDFIPRPYQIELYETAKNTNLVICLATGTGKTFIAAMLLKEMAYTVRDPLSSGGKRSVFLVPTIPLVNQQSDFIEQFTELKVGRFHGNMTNLDSWDKTRWIEEFENYHVLVMTAEIFRIIIHHGFIAFGMLNLVIFDEAHHATGAHPYAEILRCLDVVEPDQQPRIIGLSASLINKFANPRDLEGEIKKLEAIYRAKCETSSDLRSLNKYGTKPKEQIKYFEPHHEYYSDFCSQNSEGIRSALENLTQIVRFFINISSEINSRDAKKCLSDILYVYENMGLYCARYAASEYLREFANRMVSNYMAETTKIYATLISAIITSLNVLLIQLNRALEGVDERDQVTRLIPPKLQVLLIIFREAGSKNGPPGSAYDKICCILFAKQRVAAKTLAFWLSRVASLDAANFSWIKPEFIFGHGALSGVPNSITSMTSKQQEEALKKFRAHECNIMVATSVLEEGLDVPRCNLVVRFDLPNTFREYIQSKGRARAESSQFFMLIENNSDAYKDENRLSKFVGTELVLASHCQGRTIPKPEEAAVLLNSEELIEPYQPVKKDGAARVTLNTAIALVNRYCLKLPSDSFTKLAPHCTVRMTNSGGYVATLRLPINSALRDPIVGREMTSPELAKRAAALQACIELHKEKELDDNLLPVGKEALNFIEELRLDLSEEEISLAMASKPSPGGVPRPGTTKRRQYYEKRVAESLRGSTPKSAISCHLYEFTMKLTCPIPEEQNTRGRKIADPAETTRNFGILCTKKLPKICSFPVFTRSGETLIALNQIESDILVEEDKIDSLSYFHQFCFSDVLRLEKYPMKFDLNAAGYSFFIVPVNTLTDRGIKSIDWSFVAQIYTQKGKPVEPISEEERRNFSFDRSKYEDAVVLPWYRQSDRPQFFFYVAEICESLTPESQFPDIGYSTFAEYYSKKYHIKIMNSSQPLLDVDHTSARLNLLTPRYVNRKGITLPTSTAKTKKEKRENLQQKQILIPELCIIHPFPASLWRKAVCLPCLLYRVNALLIAEELRQKVCEYIGVGPKIIPNDYEWPKLDFGWTLAEVLAEDSKRNIELMDDDEEEDLEWNDGDEVPARKSPNPKAKPSAAKKKSSSSRRGGGGGGGSGGDRTPFKRDKKPSTSEADEIKMDFIIDTFDPEIYKLPEDIKKDSNSKTADKTKKSEEAPLPKPKPPVNSVPIHLPPSPVKLPQRHNSGSFSDLSGCDDDFRVGSPSRFESDTESVSWEWEKHVDLGVTAMMGDLAIPGLDYISGSSEINIQGLQMDLQTNIDLFDDMDDDSDSEFLFSDDEFDDENMPGSAAKSMPFSYQPVRFNKNSTNTRAESLLENDADLEGIRLYSEVDDKEPTTGKASENDSILNGIPSLKEKFTISRSSEGPVTAKSATLSLCDEIYMSALEDDLTRSLKDSTSETDPVNGDRDKTVETPSVCENVVISDSSRVDHTEFQSSHPAGQIEANFGELLPNREKQIAVEAPMLDIRFDPYKNDENPLGPSPSLILQALTMSNASDGINLERLETVGDSFLKYAVTAFLFCVCPNIHEGRLSYLRSKQISNLNLYLLGRRKQLGEIMMATKFEPGDNWLPPGYIIPPDMEEMFRKMSESQRREASSAAGGERPSRGDPDLDGDSLPYNLLTEHSIPDKSVADCVEALIGAYLISSGPRGALLFMKWLGLHVMRHLEQDSESGEVWHWLPVVRSPLLMPRSSCEANSEEVVSQELMRIYRGSMMDSFERDIGYSFTDKAYIVQAFTHNSYSDNHVTDCYQRLEFLGDAVLDYIITRYLFENPQNHTPGILTDLRSALVNNTFFARLAVKYSFHKYLKVLSNDLFRVIQEFVAKCNKGESNERFDGCLYLGEGETENSEEIEVPKALGDVFESVAGAIYLDSGKSLDSVWRVYFKMMKPEIEYYSKNVPKSPIRELLEMEPQNAKFGKPELISGRKIRVCVEVFGEGKFFGVGRNKRIAKCTAAKRALRVLKKRRVPSAGTATGAAAQTPRELSR